MEKCLPVFITHTVLKSLALNPALLITCFLRSETQVVSQETSRPKAGVMSLEFTLDKVFSTCSMNDNSFTTFIFKHLTEHNVQYNTDTLLNIYKIKLF